MRTRFDADSQDYIILIHDIYLPRDRSNDQSSVVLAVMKYSFKKSFPLFANEQSDSGNSDNVNHWELLLHFRDCGKMGTRGDAEFVRLDDVSFAADSYNDLDCSVFHTRESDGSAQRVPFRLEEHD